MVSDSLDESWVRQVFLEPGHAWCELGQGGIERIRVLTAPIVSAPTCATTSPVPESYQRVIAFVALVLLENPLYLLLSHWCSMCSRNSKYSLRYWLS